MKEKALIKVVGTLIQGEGFIGRGTLKTTMGRGIVPLKRGQTILTFIQDFLVSRGITTYTLFQRAEDASAYSTQPIMDLVSDPKIVLTYHFVMFHAPELGYYAKDLTKVELARDMKQLKKIVHG